MNFWPDYIKLKTAVGGNRECFHYEDSFGMPMEEQAHITMPNAHNKRIINELEFAIRLNEVQGGKFDGCIRSALSWLLSQMETEGVLTKTACDKAEAMLMPCSPDAKQYKLILAGHAHIDMDWMWSYQETVAVVLSTFRTVLNLMKQYPDFCFSQSQASVYQMVEEYDPELMAEMKQRIKEGRWEVTASAWVETDKNMPNTESLLRHIQYTKHYLQEHWDIAPEDLEIDFSPDTFGHSANIPEIDLFGGVKYLYHCRVLDGDIALYRWKAPSGKELLAYREPYWYNAAIVPKIGQGIFDISKTCAGFKTGLIVYGVGDHGGGPTRRDIEAAIEMSHWPIFPTLKFGTFREFFHEAEAVRAQLPLIDHELAYYSTGCYTTQTRIKRGNRKSEATLTDAEALMAFAQAETGRALPRRDRHEQAWQNVLYSHFHDILTGSCVQDSRENAMGQFSRALAYAQTQYGKAATALAAAIDTSSIPVDTDIALTQSEGAGGGFNMSSNCGMPAPSGYGFHIGFNNGVPNPERGCGKTRIFHIFNPLTFPRRCVTELTVWDWVGDMRRIQMTAPDGSPIPFQLVDQQLDNYWDHKFFRILVACEVPALGYTTVIMSEQEASHYPVYRKSFSRSEYPYVNHVLENDLIRAEFHRETGCLISLRDKQTGEEWIDPRQPVGLSVVTQQSDCNNAWRIGRYLGTELLTHPVHIEPVQGGELRKTFTAAYRWGMSTVKVTPMLDWGEKAIRFHVEADWNEVKGDTTPLLAFRAAQSFETGRYLCDVPGGAVYRSPQAMDMPALQYCAAIREDGGALAMVTDSKYGYRASGDALAVTLINTTGYPDPYPDRGIHHINLALIPGRDDPKALEEAASSLNHPAYFLSDNAHPGKLPMTLSFLEHSSRSTVLSAVLPNEDASVIQVRYYETGGVSDTLCLTLARRPAAAVCVDLSGQVLASDVRLDGHQITVSVGPHCLGQLKITF